MTIAAHDQKVTHNYTIHYPAHPERKDDPHYVDFNHYRRTTKATAACATGVEVGDTDSCGGGLELHHSHIEFAILNSVDLKRLEHAYPGISDPTQVGAWVESAANLTWLCEKHHRGTGTGVHSADVSDFEGEKFVKGLAS